MTTAAAPTAADIAAKAASGEKLTVDEEKILMSSHEEPPKPGKLGKDEEHDTEGGPEVTIKTGAADKVPDTGAEKTPETPGKAAEPAKDTAAGKTAEPAKTAEQVKEDPEAMARITEQLDKPPGSENLEGFTQREKGLFYEMRTLRTRAQDGETKARVLEFELAKVKKQLEEKDKKPKDPEALATNKDVDESLRTQYVETQKALFSTRLELDMTKHQHLPNFKEVMALADAGFIPEDKKTLVQEAMNKLLAGGSPVKQTYDLIVNDPRWPAKLAELEAARVKKDAPASTDKKPTDAEIKAQEAKDAAAKLKDNKGKAVTAGAGAEGGEVSSVLEYEADKLWAMSPEEFGKLPKKEQEAILKKLNGMA